MDHRRSRSLAATLVRNAQRLPEKIERHRAASLLCRLSLFVGLIHAQQTLDPFETGRVS